MFGGSWGSTLALVYAEAHPRRVLGLILRGIFLCRRRSAGSTRRARSWLFPDYWRNPLRPIPEDERGDLVATYRRLTGEDEIARMAAAAWSRWEGKTSNLLPRKEVVDDHFSEPYTALSLHIECHYS